MVQHGFSNLNKYIKQIEQVYVMSGEEKSLILVKSNQYTL